MVHWGTGSGVKNSKPPWTTLKAHSLVLAAGEWLSTVQPPWWICQKIQRWPAVFHHIFWVSRLCVGGWSPNKCPRKATQSHSRCRISWRSIPKPEGNSTQHRVPSSDFIETPTDRAPVLVYSFATLEKDRCSNKTRQEQNRLGFYRSGLKVLSRELLCAATLFNQNKCHKSCPKRKSN